MPGPSTFDKKVYAAIEQTDFLPDQFKTWLPRYLRYLSAMQVTKQQLPGIMGERFHNVGDVGEPAFVSPWRHYQGGATVFGKVRFYKDYMGVVHLEGLAETTATPSVTQIFTLPVGYRPSQTHLNVAYGLAGGAQKAVRLDVNMNGDVSVGDPAISTFTVGAFIQISNIHFRAG